MNNDFQEKDAIRYFLGELSETEQAAVEERFFTDEGFSDWLDEIETDLIDSYVRDELDISQRRRFEKDFLISERRQLRVKAAAVLWEKEKSAVHVPAAKVEPAKPSFWESLKGFFSVPGLAYASLGILLLALIGSIVLFWPRPNEIVKIGNGNIQIEPTKRSSPMISPVAMPNSNEQSNVNLPPAEPKNPPSANVQKEESKPETPPESRQASPVLSRMDLFSSSSRGNGNEANKINLKAGTENVYLRLRFKSEEEFVKYRIELRDANGNLISSQNLQSKKALGLTVAAKRLQKGNYKITLKGAKANQDFEDLDFYNFSVEKK